MKKVLFIMISIFALGCKQEGNDSLLGKWELNEIYIQKELQPKSESNKIEFFDNSRYHQSIWNGDVGNEIQGTYFLNNNSKRIYNTITLVPDIVINDGDTILLETKSYDIQLLNDVNLEIIMPTMWVSRVDGITNKFNKTLKFNKIQ